LVTLLSFIALGFDLGASSCRAFLGYIDESERAVRLVELYRWPNYMVKIDEGVYWDVYRIWYEMKYAIKLAHERSQGRLSSIGVDTWGVDFALLDDRGELVGGVHAYRDPRTLGVMEEVFKRVPRERIYERTGVQFMRINTLYQLYSMVLRRDPKLRIAKTLLMIPDLFNYWLTGHVGVEYTQATTTQFFHPGEKRWAIDILEELEIPTHILPEVYNPATVLGELKSSVVEELRLPRGLVVTAPATHDTASAVAAAPMVSENTAYISSGTWSLVGVELREPIINRKAMEYNFTNEGGAFNTIRFLKNVQGMWIVEELKKSLAERGIALDYREIVEAASRSPRARVFIDPDYEGFLAPSDMYEAIRSYLKKTNQDEPREVGELFRVVFESLALKYRLVIERLEELTGRRIVGVNIIGGGSRNEFLNKLVADVSGRVVYAGPDEATATGNILLQGAGAGLVKSLEELREYVKNSYKIKLYEPTHIGEYEDSYDRFLHIITSTSPSPA